jgi:hypothetical protein
VLKDLPHDQRVLGIEPTHQRLPQRGDLLAQLAASKFGEHGRVGDA